MDPQIPDISQLGAAIWEIREEKGIRGEKLALAADVHPTHLNRAENHGKNLTWNTLSAIARVLEVPISAVVLRAEEIAKEGRPPKVRPDAD
ncbi:MAG TPA: helix-turn-helix transcriptional regulator [Solirubrobacterales bacterium]|nr:helix-turn-helix transcriptional regulator [Solirubrobacterales bacterium]